MRLSLEIPGQRRQLGEILLEKSFVTEDALRSALESQRGLRSTKRLGTLLMEWGLISREQFMAALTMQLTVVKRFGHEARPVR